MELTKFKATLGGSEINLPKEWADIQLTASFENESTQANITTEEFTFTHEGRRIILDHIEEGYYFEGLPFSLQLKKGDRNYLAFKGFLDLQKTFKDFSTDEVKSKIKKLDGLNTLGEKLGGITYGYLDSIGLIRSQNIDYLVEERKPFIELVVTGLMIYLMIKEIGEIAKRVSDNAVELAGLISGGGLTGVIGGALLLAGKIIIDLAYATLMIKAIIDMTKDLFNQFISPVRTYKYSTYFDLLSGACRHLKLGFSSSITELHNYANLPSRPTDDKITSGIPRVGDAGYNCGDFFSIMQNMFDAKVGIIDGVVHLENKDSDFWVKRSTYKLPDAFIYQKRKNGDELKGTRLLSFITDPVDRWTIQNIKGTYYEVLTTQTSYKNGSEYLTIDSVDDRVFPFCLPNRKDTLSDLENLLKALGKIVDEVVRFFGQSSNLEAKIKNRVGMLLLGTDSHTVPRILYVINGKIPKNHRELLSAKYIYHKFTKASSFILSVNGGQKEVFENVRVGFGFEDFLNLTENSYFTTDNGAQGKVTSIKWSIDQDSAVLNYWIKDPSPSNKLKETYIEP